MPSNKNRLYVALYPSGVVNNEERKLNNPPFLLHYMLIMLDTTGAS